MFLSISGNIKEGIANALDGLYDLVRKLFMYLCAEIYELIPKFYDIFYDIGTLRYLDSEIIRKFICNCKCSYAFWILCKYFSSNSKS